MIKKFLYDPYEKVKSLVYILGSIALVLLLIVYFYQQLSVPFHDYGYQPIILASVLLYFLLPYLLMKLMFRIASFRAPEEEFQMRDIWDQWNEDLHQNTPPYPK